MCTKPLNDDIIPDDSSLFTKPKIFDLSDLVGRTLTIRRFSEEKNELVAAVDTETGAIFCLKQTMGCLDGCEKFPKKVPEIRLLDEDPSERSQFDRMVNSSREGDPLIVIYNALAVWALTCPYQGSYAKQCAIMANELSKKIKSDMFTEGV